MAKKEPLKVKVFIVDCNGKRVAWEDIPHDKQVDVANDISTRMMKCFGYEPIAKAE